MEEQAIDYFHATPAVVRINIVNFGSRDMLFDKDNCLCLRAFEVNKFIWGCQNRRTDASRH
jgi:hypothetical protein